LFKKKISIPLRLQHSCLDNGYATASMGLKCFKKKKYKIK
jgi:hypothetical protein